MYTLFLIGNIASGKSTAARYLESLGARRIDLDAMAKELYVPGSQLVTDLIDAFGWEILDADGGVCFSALARVAFASPEHTAQLNAIVHPVLLDRLTAMLLPVNCCSTIVPDIALTVVEVSAATSFTDAFGLADEVMAITAPVDIRRMRAVERGMDAEDFDRRADVQPSEEQLCGLATMVIDNTVADDCLFHTLDAWIADCHIRLGDSRA